MLDVRERTLSNLERGLEELKDSSPLTRKEKVQKLLTQLDVISRKEGGIEFIFEKSLELEKAGLFEDTPWKNPQKLLPALVKGTIRSGQPNSTMEMVNELRMLARLEGKGSFSQDEIQGAQEYLEEVIVHNLEFALGELTEESREAMTNNERDKAFAVFRFLLDRFPLDGLKEKLAEELDLLCAQRPVVTRKSRELIGLVSHKLTLDNNKEVDNRLQYYVHAVEGPTKLSHENQDPQAYARAIGDLDEVMLVEEASELAGYLRNTGLASHYNAVMLLHLVEKFPQHVPACLGLKTSGIAEWERYGKKVSEMILETVSPYNYQCVYGLAMMLERNLFGRRPLRASLNNLRLVKMNPEVEKRILKSVVEPKKEVSAKQYLIGATWRILGQPLGVGQGNNATCQSARGISMWSQHAPAKLINKIITVATRNNLVMRFENQDMESIKLGKGLVDKLDYNLDAVSVVLVPHLDKIYNEMMRRASGRGEDPHKWVNPALYGHWIQVGFASVYNYLTNSVQDFRGFIRIFYAGFHPKYNGGTKMVYPNPIGIFITNNRGEMVGFHAISLLRVKFDEVSQDYRAYFLNPNNEGRQDWGQGITPTVSGHGERAGESSLPIHHLAARLYAFHYNQLTVHSQIEEVEDSAIEPVYQLASESWGKSYVWIDTKRLW